MNIRSIFTLSACTLALAACGISGSPDSLIRTSAQRQFKQDSRYNFDSKIKLVFHSKALLLQHPKQLMKH